MSIAIAVVILFTFVLQGANKSTDKFNRDCFIELPADYDSTKK